MPHNENVAPELTHSAINDAVSLVMSRMADELQSRLAACDTETDVRLLEATHLIGMHIRSQLNLWNENHELVSQFPVATHPDSMSAEILVECWKRLRLSQ